jgi:hypothetical protein
MNFFKTILLIRLVSLKQQKQFHATVPVKERAFTGGFQQPGPAGCGGGGGDGGKLTDYKHAKTIPL